jgi:membrane protein YqaA with SNARE-associated domain
MTALAPEPSPEPRPLPLPPAKGLRARFQRMAESRFALFFMCLLSFTDACVSPIIPEVLLVPMCLLHREKQYRYAFFCSLASVVGGIVGYWLGFFLWEHGLREFAFEHVPGFTPEMFQKVSNWYGSSAFLWVWLAGFTPLPYKVFTVLAGVCHANVDFSIFVTASILSRFPRIYMTVWLLDKLGPTVMDFLLKQFSRVVLVLLLVVLGIVLYFQLR